MSSHLQDFEIKKYPFLGYAPNLIDYFLIIGYDPVFISKDIVTQEHFTQDEKKAIEKQGHLNYYPPISPTVLSTIPSLQFHNNLMIENEMIINFIFPNTPRVFVYSKSRIKEKKEKRPYCVNFGIYGDATKENNQTGHKKIYNGFAHVFYEKFDNSSFSFFVPKAFCIISQYPFFLLYNNICEDIVKLFKLRTVEIPIEILLFNVVNFTPSPISSGIRLTLFPNYSPSYYGSTKELEDKKVEKEKLSAYYESDSNEDPKEDANPFQPHYIDQLAGYPIIDFHLSKLCGLFNKNKLIELAIFSFLEIDMIFFSTNITILNLVMYLLSTFSYPCMDTTYLWHILSVPRKDMNTESKNPFVGKPFNGMVGVNCAYNESILPNLFAIYQMFFIIDIDNQEIMFYHSKEEEDEVIQTAEQIQKLRLYIDKICEDKKVKSKFLDRAIRKLSWRLHQVSLKEFPLVDPERIGDEFFGNQKVNKVQNIAIQEAFYDFILNILKEFYSFYSLSSKDEDDLSFTFVSHSEMDSSQNLSMASHDTVNRSEPSALGEEVHEIEVVCKEMDVKTEKENTNYLLHYKENIKDYCDEERIFFNLFHDSSKFIPFVRDFFSNHKVMDLYRIPLIFSEEFILIKKITKEEFSSHYFEMMNNFYSSELKQITLMIKKDKPIKKEEKQTLIQELSKQNSKIPHQLLYNLGSLSIWKAETFDEFFFVERGKQIVNFNSFYSFYGKNLKTIYFEEMQHKLHVKPKIVNGKVHFTYLSMDLDNQIILDYASFILSQNQETINKLFPSQKVIKRNDILKVRLRKITNSIEKVLVMFKTITTEFLIIYSFLLIICTCFDFIEENDIDLLLKCLPPDLFCVRKYLSMIISVIYRIALSKCKEKIANDSLKDISMYLRWCNKIVNYLNKKQILPDQQLSYLLESLYSLKQKISDKLNTSSNNISHTNLSTSSDTNHKTIKDISAEERTFNESEGSKRSTKIHSTSDIDQIHYEFHLLPQVCPACETLSTSSIQDIIQYSKNSEYDGSFVICQAEEKCKMQTDKRYHMLLMIIMGNDDAKQAKTEIYSPLKIYNTCAKIISPFYKDLNREKLNKTELKHLIVNLMFYFDNYNYFAKETWFSKFLFKFLIRLIEVKK